MDAENGKKFVERNAFPRTITVRSEIFDHWLHVIGVQGLALYLFFLRLGARTQEGAFPSYSLIAKHLRLSPSTISVLIRLLKICGLIQVTKGKRLEGSKRRTTNRYFVLDGLEGTEDRFPRASEKKFPAIYELLGGLKKSQNPFGMKIRSRCEQWKPLQILWKERARQKSK